jgi:uncharacterized protein (DUF305 family)
MPKPLVSVLVSIALASSLSACTSASDAESDLAHQHHVDSTDASDVGFTSSEIMFFQMMIPHHQQAIEMSELAITRAQDPFILELAEQISGAQDPEIDQMKGWLTAAGASLEMDHAMDMDGMLTEEQMQELAGASGADFDRLFAQYMIEHHRGAIGMLGMVKKTQNAEVAKIAQDILVGQTKEIEEMKTWLEGQG